MITHILGELDQAEMQRILSLRGRVADRWIPEELSEEILSDVLGADEEKEFKDLRLSC